MTTTSKLVKELDKLIIKYVNKLHLREKERQRIRINFLEGFESIVKICEAESGLGYLLRHTFVDYQRDYKNPKNFQRYIIDKPKEWGEYIGRLVGTLEFAPRRPLLFANFFYDVDFIKEYAPHFYPYIEKKVADWRVAINRIRDQLTKKEINFYDRLFK